MMGNTGSILAVGSELLSGQVTNRNAAWISAALADYGVDMVRHLVVDDIESDIVKGLDELSAVAPLIFVTGGLGPTSDDLTRQAVARWCGLELDYDASSWDHIVERFARMQRSVPETNKQQCYFPRGAKVLTNRAGTANAFVVKARGAEIWVLPGPPSEVEAVWTDHVHGEFQSRVPMDERRRLKMWRTIGRGESHLAEHIEPILKGQHVDVAYRAHAPYIELKIRFPERDAAKHAALCERITKSLAPWLYEVDKQDVPTDLGQRISAFASVDIYDGLTQGGLAELLATPLRDAAKAGRSLTLITDYQPHPHPKTRLAEWLEHETDADLALGLAGFDGEGKWAIAMRVGRERSVIDYPAPYKGEGQRGRNLKAIAALAAKAWLTLLADTLN